VAGRRTTHQPDRDLMAPLQSIGSGRVFERPAGDGPVRRMPAASGQVADPCARRTKSAEGFPLHRADGTRRPSRWNRA
jgi:hypothetical protein